jgi:hypothetical protein
MCLTGKDVSYEACNTRKYLDYAITTLPQTSDAMKNVRKK